MRKRPVNFRLSESERAEVFAVAKERGVTASDLLNRGRELALEEARAKLAEAAEKQRNRDQEQVRRATRGLSDEPVNVSEIRQEQLAERPSWQGRFTSPMAASWNAGRPVWTDEEKRRKYTYHLSRPHQSYGQRKYERLLNNLIGRREPAGMREFEALPRRPRPIYAIEESRSGGLGLEGVRPSSSHGRQATLRAS
jgi:hypothetical protein